MYVKIIRHRFARGKIGNILMGSVPYLREAHHEKGCSQNNPLRMLDRNYVCISEVSIRSSFNMRTFAYTNVRDKLYP